MNKQLVVTLGFLFMVHGVVHAQVQPVMLSSSSQEETVFADDPEQEQEIDMAESNAFIKKTVSSSAVNLAPALASLYDEDTLMINVPPSEIQKVNIWGKMSVPFDKFMGVIAYSNVKGGKWQCTEVAHRFLNNIYGVPTKVGNGLGHANKVVQNIYNTFGAKTYKFQNLKVKMALHKNTLSSEPPAAGSIMNFDVGKFGHVAVVRYTQVIDANTVEIYLFEQHGFPKNKVGEKKSIRSVTFNRSSDGTWVGERVLGIGQPMYWINFKVL